MIDLIATIEAQLRARGPRGDEHLAHMSAVVCDRQTWAQRKGLPFEPFDLRTLMKFELGNQFETAVCDALEAAMSADYAVERNYRMAWNPYTETTRQVSEGEECSPQEIVGHADFVATHRRFPDQSFVLEAKSTSFLRGKIPETPQQHYVEQAALYGAALKVPQFGILVGCRESGKLAPPFWFDTANHYEWAITRAKEIIEDTDPQTFAPLPEPRTSWACKTCRYSGCEKNPAYQEAV